jgi:hypothetical protein
MAQILNFIARLSGEVTVCNEQIKDHSDGNSRLLFVTMQRTVCCQVMHEN